MAAEDITVLLQQTDVSAFIGERGLGKGKLIVSQTGLHWHYDDAASSSNVDFHVPCKSVVVHAISRDTSAFPEECIYCMTEGQFPLPTTSDGSSEGREDPDEESEESSRLCELRLVPDDKSVLDTMYAAIVECQNLNPDTESESESENSSEEGEWFVGEDDSTGWIQAESNGHEPCSNGGIVLPAPGEFVSMVGQEDSRDADEMMHDGQFDDVEDKEDYS